MSSGRGRPKSSEVTEAVFAAVLLAAADSNVDSISWSQLATAAGVSRQTLYNRWPTVADIVLEALLDRAEREITVRRSDKTLTLATYLADLAKAVNGWAKPGLRSVAAMAQSDPDFAKRFRETLIAPRHSRLVEAIRASNVPAMHVELAAEMIAGSMWYRLLISGEPLDRQWREEIVHVLHLR
jgi:AcrR family transcriptional regulator